MAQTFCGSITGTTGYGEDPTPPEKQLATMLREDLGLTVDPQALRMFMRFRWDRVQKLAHKIHEGR